jgi:hypothetical protein
MIVPKITLKPEVGREVSEMLSQIEAGTAGILPDGQFRVDFGGLGKGKRGVGLAVIIHALLNLRSIKFGDESEFLGQFSLVKKARERRLNCVSEVEAKLAKNRAFHAIKLGEERGLEEGENQEGMMP